jgi:translocation protein SEC63
MVVKLVILVFFWYVLFEIINIIKDVSFDEYATFDPWVTLGIDTSASRSEIKSAYRKLSKIYHPDKNKGNKEAEQVFMEIVKANNILTDDLARSNWEKYGNPDGPRMLKIGIGCPEFLLKKENHNIILVVFFVVMLIVIPGAAFYLTRRKDDEEPIAGDIQHLYTTLNENLNIK